MIERKLRRYLRAEDERDPEAVAKFHKLRGKKYPTPGKKERRKRIKRSRAQ
jgi:hypothetical protein